MTLRRHAHQWLRSCAFPGWVCAVDRCRRRVADLTATNATWRP